MDSDPTKKDETITDDNQDPSSAGSAPPAAIHGKAKAPVWVWDRIRRVGKMFKKVIDRLKHLPKDPSSDPDPDLEKDQTKADNNQVP